MRPITRLALTVWVALAAVGATLGLNASGPAAVAGQADALQAMHAATAHNAAAKVAEELATDGHTHDHTGMDPRTKNAISRGATTTDSQTADPTTPDQAVANARSAAEQRADDPVPLTNVHLEADQPSVPTDRYNLFNACYALRSTATGGWLTSALRTDATTQAGAVPLYFKPSDLGRYLIYSPTRTFLGRVALLDVLLPRLGWGPAPNSTTDWVATMPAPGQFRFELPGSGYLSVDTSGTATFSSTASPRTLFAPVRTKGCADFPEVTTNVDGDPAAGVSPFQEARGYIDAHTHQMAFEFLGGDVHCGRPWSPYGVTVALRDCPDHYYTGGYGALMEAFLSGRPSHDPVGWPTFKDWPAPDSLTHEGTYYKWMERSWRAGQRILVNLLVENNQLCTLYPIKHNSCDDMTSIRLQAQDMHAFERYVDAQFGGPGRGWYRIVTNPAQAREVVNEGRLAVITGIETSVIFGCHTRLGVPSCTEDSIARQLDDVQKMGVVQLELVNKFDNALAGVAGDEGTTGYLVNAANTLETGSPWHMTTCNPNDPEVHDKDQDNSAPIPSQDALFGAMLHVLPIQLPAIPVYPAKHHCNTVGLSDLGAFTIREMAKRKMVFDPDHMSVKARKQSLDVVEQLGYPGVVSSHSWSTPDAYPRIYADGGFVAPYAGDSNGFVAKWKRHLTWANPKTYWGFGFGADINGLGAQGNPRPDAASNPVHYPFTGLGGVVVHQQVSGQRVYDINKDGVAHYGLYPDWIEDLRVQAGDDIVKDMERGPEAYLQMWERAYGARPDSCTNPEELHTRAWFKDNVRPGTGWWDVVMTAGQPHRRIDRTFSYCASDGALTVRFTPDGKVTSVA